MTEYNSKSDSIQIKDFIMNIQNLFKKKYVFKKPHEESGSTAKSHWAMFVSIFLLILVCACFFAYYVFSYITKEREGVYTVTSNNIKIFFYTSFFFIISYITSIINLYCTVIIS